MQLAHFEPVRVGLVGEGVYTCLAMSLPRQPSPTFQKLCHEAQVLLAVTGPRMNLPPRTALRTTTAQQAPGGAKSGVGRGGCSVVRIVQCGAVCRAPECAVQCSVRGVPSSRQLVAAPFSLPGRRPVWADRVEGAHGG